MLQIPASEDAGYNNRHLSMRMSTEQDGLELATIARSFERRDQSLRAGIE